MRLRRNYFLRNRSFCCVSQDERARNPGTACCGQRNEKVTAEFREAYERKHVVSSHMNSSSKHFSTRSIVQRRLSI